MYVHVHLMYIYTHVVSYTCYNSRYITQESHKLEIMPHVPAAVTNAVSWRQDVKHRKNEVFLDVIESVNLLVCMCIRVCHCKGHKFGVGDLG